MKYAELIRQYGWRRFTSFAASEIYARIWKRFVLRSYSQHGEDVIMDKLLRHKKRGFYVDIGAFDPYRFSNTMRFYQNGWTGITIEPDHKRWRLFTKARVKDRNLNIGIARHKSTITYYAMDPPTLSTFSRQQMREYVRNGFMVKHAIRIPVYPLKTVLFKYAPKKIDVMSVDVEGLEQQVLLSNNWKKWRPTVLCVEMSHSSPGLIRYIQKFGYKVAAKTPDNYIFTL
jgi:FkbM family methyltransferase